MPGCVHHWSAKDRDEVDSTDSQPYFPTFILSGFILLTFKTAINLLRLIRKNIKLKKSIFRPASAKRGGVENKISVSNHQVELAVNDHYYHSHCFKQLQEA